jgi:hypothetical protein
MELIERAGTPPIDPIVALQSGYLEVIKRALLQFYPYLHHQNTAFKVAVVVMGAAIVGPSTEKLVAFTGYSRSFIARISRNMRLCGFWVNGRVFCDWWDEDKNWRPARLWLHVLVAEGVCILKRHS